MEPSLIDVKNHDIHQSTFDLEGLPYLAAIIGPYSQKGKTESLLKIFHLVGTTGGCQSYKGDFPKPFDLPFKTLPCTKLRKSFFEVELKNLLVRYKTHRDLIDLTVKWSNKTREDKMMEALRQILDKNMEVTGLRQEML